MRKGPLSSNILAFYNYVYVESKDCDDSMNVRKFRVDALPLNKDYKILAW
jgi:hypothetical protein